MLLLAVTDAGFSEPEWEAGKPTAFPRSLWFERVNFFGWLDHSVLEFIAVFGNAELCFGFTFGS